MRFRRVLIWSLCLAGGGLGLYAPWSAAQSGFSTGPSTAAGSGFSAGPPVAAGEDSQLGAEQDALRSGAFHGFNADHGVVWIDDYAYWLHPSAKVDGNATKLGWVGAIPSGEIVKFITVPDPNDPRRELILRIIRP